MKKVIASFLVIVLSIIWVFPGIDVKAVPADNITELKASQSGGNITVSGTAIEGVLAAAIMIYNESGDTLITMETVSVSDSHTFTNTFTGLSKGTYLIKAANYEGGAFKETTVTLNSSQSGSPAGRPITSGGSSSSTSNTTQSGTIGGGTTASSTGITVNTNNGNAVITNIPTSTITEAANTSSANGGSNTDLVIDVSKAGNDGKEVNKVTLAKATVEAISNALNSPANNKENLVIKTGNAIVSIDSEALSAIVSQAKSDSIQLVVENTAVSNLNSSQKSAIENLNKNNGTKERSVIQTFEAYFVSGDSRISNFNGGEVTLGTVNINIPAGKNAANYHVYYIPEKGAAKRFATWVKSGVIYFKTPHFSDYAIVYDESIKNGESKPVYRLYNEKSGDHMLTASARERDMATRVGYKYEGIAFYVTEEGKKVYRLYNKNTGEHFYTVSEIEKAALIKAGWSLEGVAFNSDGDTNVYRLYNGTLHFFTASSAEKNQLVKLGWKNEGTGYKSF